MLVTRVQVLPYHLIDPGIELEFLPDLQSIDFNLATYNLSTTTYRNTIARGRLSDLQIAWRRLGDLQTIDIDLNTLDVDLSIYNWSKSTYRFTIDWRVIIFLVTR